jgi:adhesin/invasin
MSPRQSVSSFWRRAVGAAPRRPFAAIAIVAAIVAVAVACNEGFVTGPSRPPLTISLGNWTDTLVLGDQRPLGIVVLDPEGREVLGTHVRVTVAAPNVLGTDSVRVATSGSVQLSPRRTGTTGVTVSLDDSRFEPASTVVQSTVVAAGVRLLGARDTTLTSLGDTSLVLASALARAQSGASATLVPIAGQGLAWTRIGRGAVALVGTGDSVRLVAATPGTDTLVASHDICLRGARCADTLVVHVEQQAQNVVMPTDTLWAWSLGDSVAPRVELADARGNAIAGATLEATPVSAADSAILGVNTDVGVPAVSRGMVAQAGIMRDAIGAPSPQVASLPLVARANGTSHVALRALATDGRVLGTSQVVVVVRQIARTLRVAPSEADVTAGDSIPVLLEAFDARGHVIADAAFAPAMSAGAYRSGRVLVAANAPAGTEYLAATVTGVAAPSTHANAPVADPAPDSARVIVRVPPPVAAGDTASAEGNLLEATVLGADRRPLAGAWVRFAVPAGSIAPDSVLSDADGIVRARWVLPTTAGRYTATAIVLGGAARADSAGDIVLRRTTTVVPGAPAALAVVAQRDTTATLGAPLDSAVVVQLLDAYGNRVATSGVPVTVSAAGGGGFALGGTLTVVTDSLGQARFTDLSGSGAAGVEVLRFSATSSGGSIVADAAPITFSAPAASTPALSLGASTLGATPASITADGTSTATITATLRDVNGDPYPQSGGTLVLSATAGAIVSVTDNTDGTYTGILRAPTAAGSATVSGSIGGTTLGATTLVSFVAGAVSPAQTTVSVAGSVVANGSSPVTVTLRDANGNPVAGAASSIALSTSLGTLGALVDNGDGTYTAILTAPGATGTATITASVGGQSVPATLPITAGTASHARSTIDASPVSIAADGTSVSTITVRLRDAAGVPLTASGGSVTLGGSGAGTLSAVTDNLDGTYTATLTAPTAIGSATITASLDGSALTDASNPVSVDFVAGAPSAATSTLTVDAATLTISQNATASVVVKDAQGNVVAGATPGDVAFAASIGSFGATSCAAGTCSATYTATTGGSASLTATIGGTQVGGSPATIAVSTALAATLEAPEVVLDEGTAVVASLAPVSAAGGTAPYGFALTGGTLPAGLAFDPTTGVLSGTATATLARTTFTVTVTDALAATSSQSFALTVNAPLATTQAAPSTTLTVGAAPTPFAPVTASGGTAPLVYALSGGTLPDGVGFDSTTGILSGTPTASLSTTTYTVTVTDSIGVTSSRTFDLRVDGPPGAPAIGVITPGDGQLSVAFTAPASDGGSPITNYEYSTDDGASWTARTPSSTTSPVVIAGLANGTTYPVRLRAVSASGSGTSSSSAPGTPMTTPGAPSISSVTAGDGQLSVAFTAPASDGGSAITNYEYSVNGGTSWSTRSPASTTSPVVITGLVDGTSYSVALRAVNGVGAGAASSTSSGTPIGVATAPTGLAATGGNASASLTWTAPAIDGGAAITDYAVQYSTNGTSWSTFAHAASTSTAITVTGLTNGTTYQFRVAAVNAAGTGPTSALATATPGAPGSPTGLTLAFNQTSPSTLDGLFSWTAPSSSGASAISDYVVEYRVAGAPGWTTFAHTASTATSATVPGLLPSTTYEVRVSAKNTAGTGAPSAIATATTVGPSSRLQCFQPGNSNSSANAITIAPCSGVVAGNLILIPVTIANASTTTAVTISPDASSSGFTALGTQLNGSNQTTIFYKIADASDVNRATSYGFSWTGNVKNAITLVTYKTTDGNAPTYYSASGTGTTAIAPAVTVSDVSQYTLVYVYTMVGVALSSTTPSISEWTVSNDLWKNTTAGANNNLAAAITTEDVDKTAAGTTPARSATTSSMTSTTKWNAAVLVLKPAP